MQNILISGGSGLLGTHLIARFEAGEQTVSILTRNKGPKAIKSYNWNPDTESIDLDALLDTTTIIHLAGAGIAEHRWTKAYKRKILDSRIKSAELLYQSLKNNPHHVKTVIAASAVGYYGDTGDTWVDEDAHPIDDFLGNTCMQWEKAVKQIESLGVRLVILRIGVVLARDGGALPAMKKPVQFFVGAPLGDGLQYIPWIHIEDLCAIFEFAMNSISMRGAYNAVGSAPIQNRLFIKSIGRILNRPIWPLAIPAFLLKIILGEKADIVLKGQRVSNEKIRMAGYVFKHTDHESALKTLLK